jgi:hypothetical protein
MPEIDDTLFHLSAPHYEEKRKSCKENDTKFAHYCHNNSLHAILDSNSFWLRNSRYMNDYSEIDYGKDLILSSYHKNQSIKNSIDDILKKTDRTESFENIIRELVFIFLHDCYIASLSEHQINSDQFGRLSMWRAYAPENGVALILNNDVFLDTVDEYMSVTIPVNYVIDSQFMFIFMNYVDFFAKIMDLLLSKNSKNMVFNKFINGIVNLITTSKHPAFLEENEWSMIYLPKIHGISKYIDSKITNVGNITQILHPINLSSLRNQYGSMFSFDSMIYKILIGPSKFPVALCDAIVAKLEAQSLQNPIDRVSMTLIPLRT